MERKPHNSLNESIKNVFLGNMNEKHKDNSDIEQGISDFHDTSELTPPPEASEQEKQSWALYNKRKKRISDLGWDPKKPGRTLTPGQQKHYLQVAQTPKFLKNAQEETTAEQFIENLLSNMDLNEDTSEEFVFETIEALNELCDSLNETLTLEESKRLDEAQYRDRAESQRLRGVETSPDLDKKDKKDKKTPVSPEVAKELKKHANLHNKSSEMRGDADMIRQTERDNRDVYSDELEKGMQ